MNLETAGPGIARSAGTCYRIREKKKSVPAIYAETLIWCIRSRIISIVDRRSGMTSRDFWGYTRSVVISESEAWTG